MKISFVIPCYRSEHTLRGVVDEIKATVLQRPAVDFEIVLVDDCSPDGVWNTITELVSENSNIKAIQFTRNFGQHAALMAGFSHVDGDIVFSLDDDGQAPVDELWKVIDELDKGFDLVYGEYPEIKQNAFRRFGSWFNCKMNEALLGWPKGLHGSSFYACRRIIVDEAVRYDHPYPYVGGLLLRVTKKVGAVEVHQRSRIEGKSGYTLTKLIGLWLNAFTAFSVKPLRVSAYTGGICAIAGFIYGIILVIRKLALADIIAGYSSLMAVLLFVSGVLMIMLGLIGEYIGRIYICINRSPQYVIRRSLNASDIAGGGAAR